MRSQWVIGLLLASGVVAYVSGSGCNLTEVTGCYEDLVHYESLAFPLYGRDDASLDDTCGHIAVSYSCIRSYAETCKNLPDCGEDCKEIIKDILGFLSNSGLEKFAEDLCVESSPLRLTYLDNVECMEAITDEYAACHNDSQKSLSYVSTLSGEEGIEARCCYTTWFDQCFTNATRDACGENATMFVSYAIHKLVGHMIEILCSDSPRRCDAAPMAPEGEPEGGQTEEPSDIDNEIPDDKPKSDATVRLTATSVFIASFFSILLSRYVL